MRKYLALFFMVVLALLIGFSACEAATVTISVDPVTMYDDNSAIAPVDQARIIYTVYQSDSPMSELNPGTLIHTSSPGITLFSNVIITATRGSTYFFSAKATLDGMSSGYAPSVSYLYPYRKPKSPNTVNITFK